jgi:ELWxxDGT repeat protein
MNSLRHGSRAAMIGLTFLIASTGLAQHARLVQDIYPGSFGSSPASMVKVGEAIYFSTWNGPRFLRTDGTNAGTEVLGNDFMEEPVVVGSHLFFVVTGNAGKELWHLNPDTGQEELVKDIYPDWPGSDPTSLTSASGRLFFAADDGTHGKELWVSDGTDAGTTLVRDINSYDSSTPRNFVEYNGAVYFVADDDSGHPGLWRSDGTAGGTFAVTNVGVGKLSFAEPLLVVYDGLLYFSGTTATTGVELWRTNGTSSGTTMVADIVPGAGSGSPAQPYVGLGRLFFMAFTSGTGYELYSFDSQTQTVSLVKDINPGSASSFPVHFIALNGAVLFQASSAAYGGEVWRTDGTSGGTSLVADIQPGTVGAGFQWPAVQGARVYFEAATSANGSEIWMTDGTAAGTRMAAELVFGSDSSYPGEFLPLGNALLFTATTPWSGQELFALDTCDATITASGPTTFCAGGSVTLTASPGLNYSWSNGATTQSIVVTQSGNYSVSVMNDVTCSTITTPVSVTVQALPNATITPSGPTAFCQGGTVTLSAPVATGATYLWSNGATTSAITVAASGTFTVSVTNPSGCSATSAPHTVTVNPSPAAGIHSTQIYDDAGSGTVTRNGDAIEACGNPTVRLVPLALDASYSYNWSTGATTAVLDVTTSGTYTLTVTSPSGCATTSSVTVHYAAFPAKPAIAAPATELCPTGGNVTLTAPDADAWTWSNGATTQSIVVSQPGSYTVRLRVGACDSPLSDPVVVTTGLSSITTSDSLALCGTGGSATLTANAGTSWLWSNGATTRSIVVTEPGTYSVTTTNAGCTMPQSSPVTVTARSVAIGVSGPTSFCDGGSVTLTASAGTSWLWSNGATTQSITVSTSGSVSVTATFPDGCAILSAPVAVESHHAAVFVTADRTTVCPNGAIALSASASDCTACTYQWYDNTYAPIAGATSSTLTITPSTSGFVYVKVHSDLGCEATSGGTSYTVLPTPNATITSAASLCEGQSGSASVPDAGAGTTYSWSIVHGTLNFPNASSVTFTPSGVDPVVLTVTVANGACSVTTSRTVTVLPLPAASISASGPTTFCDGGSVTLTASAGSSYLWSTGATTAAINVTAGGNYRVTVTNANGCSATSAWTAVTVKARPAVPLITASGPTTFCAGGSVTLTAPAGFAYLWSTGASSPAIVVYAGGNYTVTVTNASGCSSMSAATTVTVNAATTIAQQPQTKTIPKNTTTTLSVAAGGTGTLLYQWYSGTSPSTSSPIGGATGSTYTTPKLTHGTYNYWVRVTGSCGVANSVTATITVQ